MESISPPASSISPSGSEILFSEHVFEQIHNDINVEIEKLGARYLKNIARPVVVYCIGPGSRHAKVGPGWRKRFPRFPAELRNAIAIALLVFVLLSIPRESIQLALSGVKHPKLDSKRIAVLPFISEGAKPDADDDYLSDGMTDQLISFLSCDKAASILSWNTTMKYKGSSLPIVNIGKELGAGTVIRRKLRRFEGDLIVTLKVYDVVNGRYCWSHTFTGTTDGVYGDS